MLISVDQFVAVVMYQQSKFVLTHSEVWCGAISMQKHTVSCTENVVRKTPTAHCFLDFKVHLYKTTVQDSNIE